MLSKFIQCLVLTAAHLQPGLNFNANSFLKGIGRHNGAHDYEWLDKAIIRLIACAVIIKNEHRTFKGSLISSCINDEKTGEYQLTLDAKTLALYGDNNWTGIEWEQRQALMGKPLALWLHGYFASHAAPFPIKVETLLKMCGSENKTLYKFRQQLKAALYELKNCGALAEWAIDPTSDLVTVDRGEAITDSQARHLTKIQKQLPKSNR